MISRRRAPNSKSDESHVESERVGGRGVNFGVKSTTEKCALAVVLSLLFVMMTLDLLPGISAPFAFSTRRSAYLGRRHRDVSANQQEVKQQEPLVTIPWGEWERLHRTMNHTSAYPYSGSMVNRHLFGKKLTQQQHPKGKETSPSSVLQDRDQVARVMIFKLPRSGSTWFTELLNTLPSVFISKEIIQAEFDAEYGQEERLRHLKRSLLWPTGKMSTGVWGGRFGTVQTHTQRPSCY
jgi:hypothetical protein